MSQTVSSASKAAVALAFRKARHKFPKNFGYITTKIKSCQEMKEEETPVIKEGGSGDADISVGVQKKEACEKWLEESLLCLNNQNKSEDKLNKCASSESHEEVKVIDDVNSDRLKKGKSEEAIKGVDNLFRENNCPVHKMKPHCIHHCNKCHHSDFAKKLHEWERRIQKEAPLSTWRSRRRLHRTKTTFSIKNASQNEFAIAKLEPSSSFHNPYRHSLNYCHHRRHVYRFDNQKSKLNNKDWERKSVTERRHAEEEILTKTNPSEDDSQNEVEFNKLKHKDSVLILMEKLAISKKNRGKISKKNLNQDVKKDCTPNNKNDKVQLEVRIIETVVNNT